MSRFAYHHYLYRDFYWNAQQSLEKYMKFIILVNGKITSKFGHNLDQLFIEVKTIAKKLLPADFIEILDKSALQQQTSLANFVKHISRMGCADNRYAYGSISIKKTDIYFLDYTVYHLRRMCANLDLDISAEPNAKHETFREWLSVDPNFHPRGKQIQFPKQLNKQHQSNIERALYYNNISFQIEKDRSIEFGKGLSAINSPISHLFQSIDCGRKAKLELNIQLCDWLLANVHFGKEDKDAIKKLAAELAVAPADKP